MESLILAQDKRWRRALPMRVERGSGSPGLSGVRVRNTWVTYPALGDTCPKGQLSPLGFAGPDWRRKGVLLAHLVWEGPAAYQLVGGVTAYRGDDG